MLVIAQLRKWLTGKGGNGRKIRQRYPAPLFLMLADHVCELYFPVKKQTEMTHFPNQQKLPDVHGK